RPRSGGIYFDGTAGGGGHSALLLERLCGQGFVYAMDRDPAAVAALQRRFAAAPNLRVLHGNFFNAKAALAAQGVEALDGVILDLGVSSPQLDCPERGFSFHHGGDLDMRMDQTGVTAAQWINTLPEEKLSAIFWTYGQEKFSRSMARAIIRRRETAPITTTLELAEVLSGAVPAAVRREGHPARRAFMALRYFCNEELDGLAQALLELFDLLRPEGRLAVISFNSLEDGIVKKTFQPLCRGCVCPPEFPVCVCGKKPRGSFPQKPKTPSQEELTRNPRSRSAKLRVIEKAG
ncbi:MAG: 16S rRNA (cytosine(1402)-N(4))-methyltransferase RsmH, partial [Oscillospiraceae bacterium]|nr:16S rRNA (cytosine(1402)-N(4))-methyltransferase RsmH [Oscillospiraceae bacterium]